MDKIIKSPIFYMGNKNRLIKKGLIEKFPKNIDTFVDLFCGSGVVSMNTKANKHILNDIDINMINLISLFQKNDKKQLINEIDQLIRYYKLPNFSTDNRKYKGDRTIFKERYNKLRDDYNKSRDIKLLYILNLYCNSHMIRFNKNNEFNMPFGNSYFTEDKKNDILLHNYNNMTLSNKNYKDVNIDTNCFVYCDPPYLGTNATYNESNRWVENNNKELFLYLDKLTNSNIKWALSNVFSNKSVVNKELIKWSKKYNIYHFEDFSYYSCGKGTGKTDEVLIMNY